MKTLYAIFRASTWEVVAEKGKPKSFLNEGAAIEHLKKLTHKTATDYIILPIITMPAAVELPEENEVDGDGAKPKTP